MTKTVPDLVTRVLQELRILAAGETPSAEDAALVTDEYNLALAEAEFRGDAAWTPASIPDPYFVPFAVYVAARVAPLFGREYMDQEAALARLRLVTAKPYTGADAVIDYM